MTAHSIHTEGDEYACTCGLRWDTHEEDPHSVTESNTADQIELAAFLMAFADLLEKYPTVDFCADNGPQKSVYALCGNVQKNIPLMSLDSPEFIRSLLL